MLRTKSNSRELLPTSKSREYSNKRRKRNGRKKRKVNPNFIRYNSLSIKGSLNSKDEIETQDLNYHLLRNEFLNAIIYHIDNGVKFNVEINHKSLSELYLKLTKEYDLNEYTDYLDNSIYKLQKDYNNHSGYSAELIKLFEMKENHKELYNILCGCLNVIRSKIILYFDHYSWDYAKDIINSTNEDEDEDEIIEYDFTNPDAMKNDIINSKITIEDIISLSNNNKYKALHKLFSYVISLYNHNDNIENFITASQDGIDPTIWAHFAWNLEEGEDAMTDYINMIANDEYNNQEENWFRVDVEQDSSFLDSYFELLNCFYNITLYSTTGKHETI